MECEVVVVGGGIGGLTVAALLAARGVDVCLFERESQVGGCAASFDKFGHRFEQGDGLYTGWRPDEIFDRIFSELPVDAPEVRLADPSYVVRLPDSSDVPIRGQTEEFEETLRVVFPECANAAIDFYRKLQSVNDVVKRNTTPSLQPADDFSDLLLPVDRDLAALSMRFRRFIDVQLQEFAQGTSADTNLLQAAAALTAGLDGLFTIRGGSSALAQILAESIKQSGGKIRLSSPVLRLALDSKGGADGVDLLNGERVVASRAIVSNLTIWDTYGKLVGLNRTPLEIRKRLQNLRGWGAYLIYASLDEQTAASLPSEHMLVLNDWQLEREYRPEETQFMLAVAPAWDSRGPDGSRAATIHSFTDVDEWFTYHQDETELEQRDQQLLEATWQAVHAAVPELGDGIEVIDTATPRSFYDSTRRKLGMVGGLMAADYPLLHDSIDSAVDNLFLVSDTITPGGLAPVCQAAYRLANTLTK